MFNIYKRNFKLNSFIKFFFAISVMLLLIGCERQYTQKEYKENYNQMTSIAMDKCKSHGQIYIQHYTPDLEVWEVACLQKSPAIVINHRLDVA
jgi:hypothetical protein